MQKKTVKLEDYLKMLKKGESFKSRFKARKAKGGKGRNVNARFESQIGASNAQDLASVTTQLEKSHLLHPKKAENEYYFSKVFSEATHKDPVKGSRKRQKPPRKQTFAQKSLIAEFNSPKLEMRVDDCKIGNLEEYSTIRSRLEKIEEEISTLKDGNAPDTRNADRYA